MTLLDLSLNAGIPVIPVHDEVVFPEPYMFVVKGFLIAAWQQVLHDAGRFGNLPIKTKAIKKEAVLEIVDSLCLGISGAITEDVIP